VGARGAVTVLLWTWDASAPGAGGSGVCEGEHRARCAAAAWMRANGADAGTAREVRLAVGVTLLPHYEPTGRALRARRYPGGRVRWAAAGEGR
jgi:hypothetical protein